MKKVEAGDGVAGRLLGLPHVPARYRRSHPQRGQAGGRGVRPAGGRAGVPRRRGRDPGRRRRQLARKTWRRCSIIRKRSKLLVALGDCAVTGNVPAMRNSIPAAQAAGAHLHGGRRRPNQGIPTEGVPRCCAQAVPVHEVVKVDLHVPGCPPPAARPSYACSSELLDRAACPNPASEGEISDRRASRSPCKVQKITIDPVTRIEGHAKIDHLAGRRRQRGGYAFPRHPGARLREIHRRPAVL